MDGLCERRWLVVGTEAPRPGAAIDPIVPESTIVNGSTGPLVFDLDGTLIDSLGGIAATCRVACRAIGAPEPTDSVVVPLIGLPLAEMMRCALPPDIEAERVTESVVIYRSRFDDVALPMTKPFPGVARLLGDWARQNRPLAVATSKSIAVAERVLAYADLRRHFTVVCGGDEVSRGKPAPDLAHLALDRLGATPDRAIVVGDTAHDMRMAVAAGVRAIGVTYGAHDRATLLESGAHVTIDRFDDLAKLFDG